MSGSRFIEGFYLGMAIGVLVMLISVGLGVSKADLSPPEPDLVVKKVVLPSPRPDYLDPLLFGPPTSTLIVEYAGDEWRCKERATR